MSWREVGWVIFLAGLPFAHLCFQPLDIWHGHAAWAQLWCLVLFGLSLGAEQAPHRPNKPLAAFLIWVGVMCLNSFMTTIKIHKIYPLGMLQGMMHLLIIYFFYLAATTTWTKAFLEKLLRIMAWSGVVLLLYCGLQLLSLDQFFHDLDIGIRKDQLVGTIGNPSHLAIHLALLLSLFLLQPGAFWMGCAIACGGLVLLTKSLGGQLAALAVVSWWAWHRRKPLLIPILLLLVVGAVWGFWHLDIINPHGRLLAWQEFYRLFTMKPITGLGVGYVMEFSKVVTDGPIFQWRHVHNEYFQLALETGLIGLLFILWMVKDLFIQVWKLKKTPTVVALSGMLVAFGINSVVNFPAHLWLVGSYALVGYCGLRILWSEGA